MNNNLKKSCMAILDVILDLNYQNISLAIKEFKEFGLGYIVPWFP